MNFSTIITRITCWINGTTPVKCGACNKLTEPSILEGNICSLECLNKKEQHL